ncbi:MAG: DUF3108 domain-containing protein [Alphaproteobacteria bacterium]|nr:DUF3108 domain-containing protein [Alphaproteobacteria bacterium]
MPHKVRSSGGPRRLRAGPTLLLAAVGALLSAPSLASTDEAARADAPALVAPDAISVPMERGLRLEYEGYFGGLHIGSARAVLERRGGEYRVSAEARARGLLEWFSQWRGRAETRGRLVDAADVRDFAEPKPDLHRNRGEWRGDPRWSILTYDADGRVSAQDGSPPDPNELTPIPDGSTRDTIDPISAIVAMAEVMQDGGLCEADLQLFDGRRRYDLTVRDGGVREFAPNDYTIFEGEARGCKLEIERIGGFRIERSKYAETARDRTVWVGRPIPGGPPVPVRVEIETAYGAAVVHLVGAYSADQRIALEPGRDVMADND